MTSDTTSAKTTTRLVFLKLFILSKAVGTLSRAYERRSKVQLNAGRRAERGKGDRAKRFKDWRKDKLIKATEMEQCSILK